MRGFSYYKLVNNNIIKFFGTVVINNTDILRKLELWTAEVTIQAKKENN